MTVSVRHPFGPVVSLSLALAALALPMAAAAVDCGDVITEDTLLDADLTCAGDALVAGADGITIDLGGHTVRGTGPGQPGFGVTISGHQGVTVENGRVLDFLALVYVDGAADTVLRSLTLGSSEGAGIAVFDSTGTRIEENAIADTPIGTGIYVVDSSTTAIVRNVLTRANLLLDGLAETQVTDNLIQSAPLGIALGHAEQTRLERNVVVGSTRIGIHVGYANGTSVSANVAYGNGGDGIDVGADATGTVLTANVATANGGDGIDVQSPSSTLTRNVAARNAQLGIRAVAGVTDGGGNVAFKNGDRAQCTGVRCRPR